MGWLIPLPEAWAGSRLGQNKLGFIGARKHEALAQRAGQPFQGTWAGPGGLHRRLPSASRGPGACPGPVPALGGQVGIQQGCLLAWPPSHEPVGPVMGAWQGSGCWPLAGVGAGFGQPWGRGPTPPGVNPELLSGAGRPQPHPPIRDVGPRDAGRVSRGEESGAGSSAEGPCPPPGTLSGQSPLLCASQGYRQGEGSPPVLAVLGAEEVQQRRVPEEMSRGVGGSLLGTQSQSGSSYRSHQPLVRRLTGAPGGGSPTLTQQVEPREWPPPAPRPDKTPADAPDPPVAALGALPLQLDRSLPAHVSGPVSPPPPPAGHPRTCVSSGHAASPGPAWPTPCGQALLFQTFLEASEGCGEEVGGGGGKEGSGRQGVWAGPEPQASPLGLGRPTLTAVALFPSLRGGHRVAVGSTLEQPTRRLLQLSQVPPALRGTRSGCHRRGRPRQPLSWECAWAALLSPAAPGAGPHQGTVPRQGTAPGHGQRWTHHAGSVAATRWVDGAGLCAVWVRGGFGSANKSRGAAAAWHWALSRGCKAPPPLCGPQSRLQNDYLRPGGRFCPRQGFLLDAQEEGGRVGAQPGFAPCCGPVLPCPVPVWGRFQISALRRFHCGHSGRHAQASRESNAGPQWEQDVPGVRGASPNPRTLALEAGSPGGFNVSDLSVRLCCGFSLELLRAQEEVQPGASARFLSPARALGLPGPLGLARPPRPPRPAAAATRGGAERRQQVAPPARGDAALRRRRRAARGREAPRRPGRPVPRGARRESRGRRGRPSAGTSRVCSLPRAWGPEGETEAGGRRRSPGPGSAACGAAGGPVSGRPCSPRAPGSRALGSSRRGARKAEAPRGRGGQPSAPRPGPPGPGSRCGARRGSRGPGRCARGGCRPGGGCVLGSVAGRRPPPPRGCGAPEGPQGRVAGCSVGRRGPQAGLEPVLGAFFRD
ncbi:collagen alpha-1(I) chain-like [Hippopotamus amphibius kiboko]|uniref:collagen alpha-1(I) chain-like n=1 Tax=Hippopotamus amphibius kiboko TaxID=575201 RepID=UPI002591967C|nr:collagen alpha-1(I) chain-like [Hippopotamus amphibius kiboko]